MPGTNFPTALDTTTTLRTVADATDDVLAIDQNYPRDAIIAAETKLGVGADTPTVGKFLVGNTTAGSSQWRVLADADIPSTLTGKTLGPTNLFSFNSPRGYLLNGKIVPSVATSHLTVAIKGLDGNDPSATNPVYCRIGDTVRSITAALSVTLVDGTNWFNAGSTELLGTSYPCDYFVYLGYNATDGVTVGFSRINHAREYNDFSATTTNQAYCAISNISNAAAGDDYEVIGRFSAYLSLTPDFLWSVPTFTNKNLIQRPIYETDSLAYYPILTGTGFDKGTSAIVGKYKLIGRQVFFSTSCALAGITAGTGTDWTIKLPFTTINDSFGRQHCSLYCYDVNVDEIKYNAVIGVNLSYVNEFCSMASGGIRGLAFNAPQTFVNGDVLAYNGYFYI